MQNFINIRTPLFMHVSQDSCTTLIYGVAANDVNLIVLFIKLTNFMPYYCIHAIKTPSHKKC